MRRIWLWFAALVLVLTVGLSPALAQRRGMRGGKVYTAYGLAYDTSSPEWRMAGGNLEVYQQIVAEKAWQKQQQLMMAQQRKLLAQQKAQQKAFERWAKENPEAYLRWQAQQQLPQLRRSAGRRR